jgi:hypothetical protein
LSRIGQGVGSERVQNGESATRPKQSTGLIDVSVEFKWIGVNDDQVVAMISESRHDIERATGDQSVPLRWYSGSCKCFASGSVLLAIVVDAGENAIGAHSAQ